EPLPYERDRWGLRLAGDDRLGPRRGRDGGDDRARAREQVVATRVRRVEVRGDEPRAVAHGRGRAVESVEVVMPPDHDGLRRALVDDLEARRSERVAHTWARARENARATRELTREQA